MMINSTFRNDLRETMCTNMCKTWLSVTIVLWLTTEDDKQSSLYHAVISTYETRINTYELQWSSISGLAVTFITLVTLILF